MSSGQNYYNNHIEEARLERIASCWQLILQAPRLLENENELLEVALDLPNQRVVNLDVVRTRMNLLNPELSATLEKALTLFCKRNGVLYKQGINEIMVPFVAWRRCPGVPLTSVYDCFEAFFRRYLLNLYFDEEFNSLELLFRLITIILKYHDPALARFLAENDITPELYSTAWFMTLFANKLSIELLYLFWQVYIVEEDEFFIFYVIVGLLLYNKYRLLQTKECELPQFITELSFSTPEQLSGVLKIALLLRKYTPKSLFLLCKQKRLFERCQDYKYIRAVLHNIENINLFLILPEEIVDGVYGSNEVCCSLQCAAQNCYFCRINSQLDSSKYQHFVEDDPWLARTLDLSNDVRALEGVRKFVVLDIRSCKDRILIDSELIDITQPFEAIEEGFLANFLEKRGKIHFVFLFTQFRFDSLEKCQPNELAFCKKLIEVLYSAGFQCMGILEGGFQELERAIRSQMLHQSAERNCKAARQLRKSLPSSSIFRSNSSIAEHDVHYYLTNGLNRPVRLTMLPGLLFSLERLASNSKLIMSDSHVLLISESNHRRNAGFCVIFRNNQLLKDVLRYLGNSKSLIEYFLSGLKAQYEDDILEVESVFFCKDLEKLSTKETVPGLLFLYFRVFHLKEDTSDYSKHIAALSSRQVLAYLQTLSEKDCHCLYDQIEGSEHRLVKKKIMCDAVQLSSCVDHIKACFLATARSYREYRRQQQCTRLLHSPSI